MKPQRTCIACGKVCDQDKLLRITFDGENLLMDDEKKSPGRGCYICRSEDCINLAVKKRAFNRAFKKEISGEALGRCFNGR